jgi:DNA-binding beta-propeller fold protein YncE
LAVLGLLACGACVPPAGEIFPPPADPRVWPPPPAEPRIRYVGALTSSADLKTPPTFWQLLTGPDPPARVVAPLDVVVTPGPVVFVADRDGQAVHRFDLAARKHEWIGSGTLELPAALAWHDGRLFIADAGRGEVFAWNEQRRSLTRFDRAELERPSGLAFVPSIGTLFVADARQRALVGLDDSGSVVRRIPSGDQATVGTPAHLAYDPGLGLLVCDAVNGRVVRLTPEGESLGSLGSLGDGSGNLALPRGVAVDTYGNVYVVDARFENVQIFDGDGRVLMAFGEEGVAPGQFNLPSGICIDASQRVWVADAYNCRVQVFQFLGPPAEPDPDETPPPPAEEGATDE